MAAARLTDMAAEDNPCKSSGQRPIFKNVVAEVDGEQVGGRPLTRRTEFDLSVGQDALRMEDRQTMLRLELGMVRLRCNEIGKPVLRGRHLDEVGELGERHHQHRVL